MTDADSWTDIQHMSPSLFLLYSDKKVEETGGLCVEKIDVIACDFRKEGPFSKRAWRAIRLPLIPACGALMGGANPREQNIFSFTGKNFPSELSRLHNDRNYCVHR